MTQRTIHHVTSCHSPGDVEIAPEERSLLEKEEEEEDYKLWLYNTCMLVSEPLNTKRPLITVGTLHNSAADVSVAVV